MKLLKVIILGLLLILGISCAQNQKKSPKSARIDKIIRETEVKEIKLSNPLSNKNSEVSGMCWYKQDLYILPQYPNIFRSNADGVIFSLSLDQLDSYLNNDEAKPLIAKQIQFFSSDIENKIPGFEGYESLIIRKDKVYITIEAETDRMQGYLVSGTISLESNEIRLNSENIVRIESKVNVPNACYESMLMTSQGLVVFHEANGINNNPSPVASLFDFDLNFVKEIPMPKIEYRITDVSGIDHDNNFYAINYFWPGEKDTYKPENDFYVKKFGKGISHVKKEAVERLIELNYSDKKISKTSKAPIYLKLLPDNSRNWEGLVRYRNGFLIITDKFPNTILGYIE